MTGPEAGSAVPAAGLLVGVLLGLAVLTLPRRSRRGVPGRPPGADRAPGVGGPHRAGRRRGEPDGPLTGPDVATVMVLLAVALRSGCGATEAVEAVADVHEGAGGPVPAQLRSVAAALRWGVAPAAAWAAADPGWERVATVLAVAARAGTAPGPSLLRAARDLRADEAGRVEVAAARVGVHLVAPLGLVFLPAFVLTTLVPVVLALGRRVLG